LEEMGITRLGHQKKILLAIKHVKDVLSGKAQQDANKLAFKTPMSPGLYQRNPSVKSYNPASPSHHSYQHGTTQNTLHHHYPGHFQHKNVIQQQYPGGNNKIPCYDNQSIYGTLGGGANPTSYLNSRASNVHSSTSSFKNPGSHNTTRQCSQYQGQHQSSNSNINTNNVRNLEQKNNVMNMQSHVAQIHHSPLIQRSQSQGSHNNSCSQIIKHQGNLVHSPIVQRSKAPHDQQSNVSQFQRSQSEEPHSSSSLQYKPDIVTVQVRPQVRSNNTKDLIFEEPIYSTFHPCSNNLGVRPIVNEGPSSLPFQFPSNCSAYRNRSLDDGDVTPTNGSETVFSYDSSVSNGGTLPRNSSNKNNVKFRPVAKVTARAQIHREMSDDAVTNDLKKEQQKEISNVDSVSVNNNQNEQHTLAFQNSHTDPKSRLMMQERSSPCSQSTNNTPQGTPKKLPPPPPRRSNSISESSSSSKMAAAKNKMAVADGTFLEQTSCTQNTSQSGNVPLKRQASGGGGTLLRRSLNYGYMGVKNNRQFLEQQQRQEDEELMPPPPPAPADSGNHSQNHTQLNIQTRVDNHQSHGVENQLYCHQQQPQSCSGLSQSSAQQGREFCRSANYGQARPSDACPLAAPPSGETVLSDIGHMLADLSEELEAMLETE